MHNLNKYSRKENIDLDNLCTKYILNHYHLFESRKSSDLQKKVHETLFQIISNLSARSNDEVYNFIIFPQSKTFYSSPKNLLKEFITFKSVQIAQKILISEGLIKFNKSTGWIFKKDEVITIKETSFATLTPSNLVPEDASFLEALYYISMIFPNFTKPECVLTKSNDITKFFKKKERNRKAGIKKLKSKSKRTEKEDKKLESLLNKNNKKKLMDKMSIFDIDLTKEKKVVITPDRRLTKYNQFLAANGMRKYQYAQVYGNNKSEYGRFYSAINQISKVEREFLYKDEVLELDFEAFTPNIIYLLESDSKYISKYGHGNDVYTDITIDLFNNKGIEGYEVSLKFYRSIIKKCLNIIFASTTKDESDRAIRLLLLNNHLYYNPTSTNKTKKSLNKIEHYFKKNNGDLIFLDLYEKQIIDVIKQTAPLLEKYFYSDFSKVSQKLESETMLDVLEYCVDHDIIALSIHDAVICPSDNAKEIHKVLEACLNNTVVVYKQSLIRLPKFYNTLNNMFHSVVKPPCSFNINPNNIYIYNQPLVT